MKISLWRRIKFKILGIKINIHIRRILIHSFRSLWHIYKAITYIGIPKDPEQLDLLKRAISDFDARIADLETYIVRGARKFIKED